MKTKLNKQTKHEKILSKFKMSSTLARMSFLSGILVTKHLKILRLVCYKMNFNFGFTNLIQV